MLIPHLLFTTPVANYVNRRLVPNLKHAPDTIESLGRFRLDALDGYGDAHNHADLAQKNSGMNKSVKFGVFKKLKNLAVFLPRLV
ncbi:hypothetical protein [Undibacterium sp. Ren11W]|uniref:hypothetical protein n=1 Tax=Undibacterium sp. Ren11W TaxID=3413045 RepID=UPI003BF57DB0